jgi:uncharacterized membrane protein
MKGCSADQGSLMQERQRFSSTFIWAGYLLGFALGGFFDGILLHQILQWHHLLSLVDGVGDVRNQVLFDGVFHALMYVLAAVGLALLIRGGGDISLPDAGRWLIGSAMIGFGVWHILDSIASHWLFGIHRIKLDSPNPLMWDLIWFVAFGAVPLLVGVLMRRDSGRDHRLRGRTAATGIVMVALIGAPWAARSPADSDAAIAVFRPGMSEVDIMAAVVSTGGSLLWESRGVWAVRWDGEPRPNALFGKGALLVSNSFLAAGCLAWSQV